jgi:hypothetical protein
MPQRMVGVPQPKTAAPRTTAAEMASRGGQPPGASGRPNGAYARGGADIRNPYEKTAQHTGTSFDMADLLSHGHAFKPPKKVLPSTDAKMMILGQTEQTMPGDFLGQNPDETSAYDRMGRLVRSRNLDMLNLMDDFLKRPRNSRMPVRNRAFVDVSTFRRQLCYAFGDQWIGLALSNAEFEAIWKPYERKDNNEHYANTGGSGYQGGGQYGAGQGGQPESLILWQQFAQDLQRYVDGDNRNDAEKALLAAELEHMARAEAAEAAALAARDGDDNMGDAKANRAAKDAARAEAAKKPIGNRGCTVGQVGHAKKMIANKLTGAGGKYDTVREALRDIDNSGDGILSRDEVKLLLNEHYLLKYVDFYTGQTRGQLDEVVIDTILDMCDKNGDGEIKCDEFAQEVLAGANTYFFEDMADSFESTFDIQGM